MLLLLNDDEIFIVLSLTIEDLILLVFTDQVVLPFQYVFNFLVAGFAEALGVVRSVLVGAAGRTPGVAFFDVAEVTHEFCSVYEIEVGAPFH